MSAGCMARMHRAPRRAQIFRGNASKAGKPIWNGRIESGRKLSASMSLATVGIVLATDVRAGRSGDTMVPAWPRAWMYPSAVSKE